MRWIVPPFNARTTRDEDEGTLVFSAPGLNAISYTRTLSFSTSTFCVAAALAAFCCAIAEFTTAPANRNAGTSSPARTAANLLMISPFFPPEMAARIILRPSRLIGGVCARYRCRYATHPARTPTIQRRNTQQENAGSSCHVFTELPPRL